MNNIRKYGDAPFKIAVIHGGPGAPGSMAPVARALSVNRGVLEPLQTANSLEGQVQELQTTLEEHSDLPVTLIGSSWGAMLSFIFSARYPKLVKKLILVGSGSFEEGYAANIMDTRLNRLSEDERNETLTLMERINSPGAEDALLARLGELCGKADDYNPIPHDSEVLECQRDIHIRVWGDAQKLRASGDLLELGKQIQCPVIAIHGDYDSHPADGVQIPLTSVLSDFRFILLERCGHSPWIEKEAKDYFYEILEDELN